MDSSGEKPPPADTPFNKIDLSALQNFQFGTQWSSSEAEAGNKSHGGGGEGGGESRGGPPRRDRRQGRRPPAGGDFAPAPAFEARDAGGAPAVGPRRDDRPRFE